MLRDRTPMAALTPICRTSHLHMLPLIPGMVCAVATSQYSGAELRKALRRDIDDLARTKALQVQSSDPSSVTCPCLLLHWPRMLCRACRAYVSSSDVSWRFALAAGV